LKRFEDILFLKFAAKIRRQGFKTTISKKNGDPEPIMPCIDVITIAQEAENEHVRKGKANYGHF